MDIASSGEVAETISKIFFIALCKDSTSLEISSKTFGCIQSDQILYIYLYAAIILKINSHLHSTVFTSLAISGNTPLF